LCKEALKHPTVVQEIGSREDVCEAHIGEHQRPASRGNKVGIL